MKPQKAFDLVEAALQAVDPKLRIHELNCEDLPASAKTEFSIWVDTGPTTVGNMGWIKNGKLQWDAPGGYTYHEIANPKVLGKWAAKRKSLFETQKITEEMKAIFRDKKKDTTDV